MRKGPIPRSTLRNIRLPIVNSIALRLFRRALRKRTDLFPPETFAWAECMFVPDLVGNFAFDEDGPVDSFRLAITNNWFDQRINGLALAVNGRVLPLSATYVRVGGRLVPAEDLHALEFESGPPTELIARGVTLGSGLNIIEMELALDVATLYVPVPVRMQHGQGEVVIVPPEPPEPEAQPKRIHYVPHVHHDVEWLATRQRFDRMSARNLLEVLRLLDENPDYTFTLDQIPQLEAFRQSHTAAFEKLRQYVEAGRVEIVNGLVAEPDTNLVSGESLVMGSVLFQKYAKRTFGRTCPVGWLIDSFGQSAQLPQILAKSGTEFFAFCRIIEENEPPAEFFWEGPDGSRILCHYVPLMYFAGYAIPDDESRAMERFRRLRGRLAARSAGEELLLPAGIDHGKPQAAPARQIPAWNEAHPETRIEFSVPGRYFRSVRREGLPIRKGEFQRVFPGVWSVRPEIKQLNRRAEALIEEAEKLAALASLAGTEYPRQALEDAWVRLLSAQFHDRICGCLADDAAKSVTAELESVVADLDRIASDAATFLAGRLAQGDGAGVRFVAFNLLSFDRSEWVELEIDNATDMDGFAVLADDGPIAHQVLDARRYHDGRLKSVRLGFVAKIPAMGYRAFRFARVEQGVRPEGAALAVSGEVVDGGIWKVTVNRSRGTIRTVEGTRDKLSLDLLSAGELLLDDDGGDMMASDPLRRKKPVGEVVDRVLWTETGPLTANLRTYGRIGRSPFVRDIRFYGDLRRIDVTTRVDFRDAGKRLRARIGTGAKLKRWVHEVPYGVVERDGRELPAHSWVDAADRKKGLAILNFAIAGHEIDGRAALLSLLRSKDTILFMDAGPGGFSLGKHEFRYSLVPHTGDWREAMLWQRGRAFNLPVRVVRAGRAAGGDSPKRSLVTIDRPNVSLTAMRRTDDGAYELRLVECAGEQTRAGLWLDFPAEAVHVTDMLGTPLAELPLRGGVAEFVVGPYEILTLRLTVRA